MEHFIYFIQGQNSGRIKIGSASCPNLRLRHMQHYCTEPLKLVGCLSIGESTRAEAERLELLFQTRFRESWAWGEIFNASPELLGMLHLDPHQCSKCPKSGTPLGPWNRHSHNLGREVSAEQRAKASATLKALWKAGVFKKS